MTSLKKYYKKIALLTLAVLGTINIIVSMISLDPSVSDRKDFTQEYLMSKALLNGSDPYSLLTDLENQFPLLNKPKLFPHHSAHPPLVAIIGLPFALLPYYWAAVLWLFFEILLISLSVYLLILWWNPSLNKATILLLILSFFAWEPVLDELVYGQLNSLLLIIFVFSWLNLRADKQILGGILLGAAIAIKIIAWPVMLFLLAKKKWNAFISVVLSAFLSNAFALVLIGHKPFLHYYTTTSKEVLPVWHAHVTNFSIFTLGLRIFEGAHGYGAITTKTEPLILSTRFAETTSYIIPAIFLVYCLLKSINMKNYDLSICLIICSCIVLSPISWSHYMLLLILPIVVVAYNIFALWELIKLKHKNTYVFTFITFVLMATPGTTTQEIMYYFESYRTTNLNGEVVRHIPFLAGLVTLTPLLATVCLIILIYIVDSLLGKESICPNQKQITQHLQ